MKNLTCSVPACARSFVPRGGGVSNSPTGPLCPRCYQRRRRGVPDLSELEKLRPVILSLRVEPNVFALIQASASASGSTPADVVVELLRSTFLALPPNPKPQ